jgi:hypothetical protein
MFDLESSEWVKASKSVEEPSVVVSFLTQVRFYVGDPNDPDQLDDESCYLPLATPNSADSISVASVVGKEEALAGYYRRVVELAAARGQGFDQFGHHFWMRLAIRWRGGQCVFPWYDTWGDMDRLLGWLPLADDGEQYWDIDQGWELVVVRKGDAFHFRQGDGYGNESENVRLDREALLRSLKSVRSDVREVIDELEVHLGADVWTKRIAQQQISFGAPDWDPRRPPSS